MKKLMPVIALALGFAGCEAIRANETRWTEQLLTAAGFQAEPAATAEELARLQTLKPRRVIQERRDGEPRYTYADPDVCKCVYAGGEPQYQKYQKLRIEKETAEAQASAVVYGARWNGWSWP